MGGRGSGGRNRKPLARKKVEGNRGRRKQKTSAAPALARIPGEPAMPSFLTPRQKAVWRMLVPILKDNGVLTPDCGIALGTLCSSYVHFSEADVDVAHRQEEIRAKERARDSIEEQIDALNKRLGSASRRRSDLLRHLRASWQGFGLDPSSRSGISPADPQNSDQMKSAIDRVLSSKSDGNDVVM